MKTEQTKPNPASWADAVEDMVELLQKSTEQADVDYVKSKLYLMAKYADGYGRGS